MNLIEKVAKAIEDYVIGMNESRMAAQAAICAMPSIGFWEKNTHWAEINAPEDE